MIIKNKHKIDDFLYINFRVAKFATRSVEEIRELLVNLEQFYEIKTDYFIMGEFKRENCKVLLSSFDNNIIDAYDFDNQFGIKNLTSPYFFVLIPKDCHEDVFTVMGEEYDLEFGIENSELLYPMIDERYNSVPPIQNIPVNDYNEILYGYCFSEVLFQIELEMCKEHYLSSQEHAEILFDKILN